MPGLESIKNTLAEIVRRHGTPTYAYDVRRLRAQANKLREHLPDAVEILYSLKANASLGICDVLADCGLGADVASSGELATAIEAGFAADRIFVAGPWKLPEAWKSAPRITHPSLENARRVSHSSHGPDDYLRWFPHHLGSRDRCRSHPHGRGVNYPDTGGCRRHCR